MGYQEEQKKLERYETDYAKIRKEEDVDLGYRDMNSRFLNLEKQTMTAEEWRAKEAEHKERKKQIERAWQTKTDVSIYEQIARQGKYKEKDAKYYAPFDLSVLEIFLKKSSRGKENSDEYNSVVTDLELYNLMVHKSAPKERVTLLENLQSSCATYISEKHPISGPGRKRKAMITQVAEQVNLLLADAQAAVLTVEDQNANLNVDQDQKQINIQENQEQNAINLQEEQNQINVQEEEEIANQQEDNILQEAEGEEIEEKLDDESIQELKDLADSTFENLKDNCENYLTRAGRKLKLTQNWISIDLINQACKAHYRLISLDLQGKIQLTEEERGKLDQQMKQIFSALSYPGGVDEDQTDIMSTRFFNALGWSEHKPRICKNIETEIERFPNRVKMFHSINKETYLNMGNVVAQMLGKRRQYYSFGGYGQGIYTATRKVEKQEDVEQEDLKASEHSWLYAQNVGSVQFTFTLNEHAKVIEQAEVPAAMKMIREKYPQAFAELNFFADINLKRGTAEGFRGSSIILAFLGYNTVRVKTPDNKSGDVVEYYCTTDRKALSTNSLLEYVGVGHICKSEPVINYRER